MGSLGAVKKTKRVKAMQQAVAKPKTIKDSRFGLRKTFLNPNESPRIGVYMNPGRGPNGEHQS